MSNLDEESAKELAKLWTHRMDGDDTIDEKVQGSVVLMNFTAPPAVQWVFICAALNNAQTDESLGHLAAGPLEHLLGKHGDDCIDRVEIEAKRTPKFAWMMTGVWRHQMSDMVWARVEAIKASAIASGKQLAP